MKSARDGPVAWARGVAGTAGNPREAGASEVGVGTGEGRCPRGGVDDPKTRGRSGVTVPLFPGGGGELTPVTGAECAAAAAASVAAIALSRSRSKRASAAAISAAEVNARVLAEGPATPDRSGGTPPEREPRAEGRAAPDIDGRPPYPPHPAGGGRGP